MIQTEPYKLLMTKIGLTIRVVLGGFSFERVYFHYPILLKCKSDMLILTMFLLHLYNFSRKSFSQKLF